jgi:hypothetical protein
MIRAGHIACIGPKRNLYRILAGKARRKETTKKIQMLSGKDMKIGLDK